MDRRVIGGIRADKPPKRRDPADTPDNRILMRTVEDVIDLMRLRGMFQRAMRQRLEARTLLVSLIHEADEHRGYLPAKARREVQDYLERTTEPSDFLRDMPQGSPRYADALLAVRDLETMQCLSCGGTGWIDTDGHCAQSNRCIHCCETGLQPLCPTCGAALFHMVCQQDWKWWCNPCGKAYAESKK
jgi:hypothetical protein